MVAQHRRHIGGRSYVRDRLRRFGPNVLPLDRSYKLLAVSSYATWSKLAGIIELSPRIEPRTIDISSLSV